MDKYRHLAVLAIALAETRGRPQYVVNEVRKWLMEHIEQAFEDVQLDWATVEQRNDGDDILLFVSHPTTSVNLASLFVWALERGLGRRNKQLTEAYQIRIRIALAEGSCHYDGMAWIGDAITSARRLVRTERLRAEQDRASRPAIAFIVADPAYRNIRVSHLIDEDAFCPVTVARRDDQAEPAWVQIAAAHPEPGPARPVSLVHPRRPTAEATPPVANGRTTHRPAEVARLVDTLADGWATEHFEVRFATIRGRTHRETGVPRQDGVAAVQHRASGAVVFAVTDGVPWRSRGWQAATTACEAVVGAIVADLDREAERIDWHPAVGRTDWPLVAGMVRPTASGVMAWLVQIGAGNVWIRRDGVYRRVPELPAPVDGRAFTLVVTGPEEQPDLMPRVAGLEAADLLLVGSAGMRGMIENGAALPGGPALRPPLDFAYDLRAGGEDSGEDRTLLAVRVKPYG